MWRPVALSAFLALLFMSSRSGQEPVETQPNDLAKTDLGQSDAQTEPDKRDQGAIKIDLEDQIDPAKSSEHHKTETAGEAADLSAEPLAANAEDATAQPQTVASIGSNGSTTIPLPVPKANPSAGGTRVVITQGEQKTALTTDEEALRLMPPGPDFAAKAQRELARLGCYKGRVDNIWGPMSRNAVARFNRVAKAKLPLRQPTRALLGSTRKAPDGYCNGGGDAGSRVAALQPGAGLEDLKQRPSYLPPWMRGEAMPQAEPATEQAEAETEAEATPSASSASTTARERRAKPQRTQRARSRQAQRRQVRRRQARRRSASRGTRSFGQTMDGRGSFWPGQ
jgi:hypothetical protein